MKTKFILHGGFTRIENELNKTFFNELVKDIPENGNVLMCFFASGEKDKVDVFTELSERIKMQSNKTFTFVLATKNDFLQQLEVADVVYFHGGHTRALLDALREYENLEELFINKTVAGSSAGAYALAQYGTAHDEDHTREGLGILKVRVVCHYESKELPPNETSLEELREASPESELVILKDCEWRVLYS